MQRGSSGCGCYSHRQRANVLVHVKEVVWIVLRLELLEPSIVGSIRGDRRIARLIMSKVIHIAAGSHEGFHLRVCFSRPGNAPICNDRLHPFGEHKEVVTGQAVWEGGIAGWYPGCSAV